MEFAHWKIYIVIFLFSSHNVGMTLQEILEDIGSKINLSFRINSKGRCILKDRKTDREYILESSNPNYFYLYTLLGFVPDGESSSYFLKSLLSMNLFGQQTFGMTIGVEPNSGQIILHFLSRNQTIQAETLLSIVRQFISATEIISQKIMDLQQHCASDKWNARQEPEEIRAADSENAKIQIIRI